jgi:hypothetical protein
MTHAIERSGLSRRDLLQTLAALSAAGLLPQAWAQAFPSRGVRLISGASAGSASDIIGRAIGEKLQAELGQSVVLENRVGAGGAVAIQALQAAPADGHTIFVYTAAHTVVPLISKVNYDPVRDFSGVTPLAVVPNVMVVSETVARRSAAYMRDVLLPHLLRAEAVMFSSVQSGHARWIAGFILSRGEGRIALRDVVRAYGPLKAPEQRNELLSVMQSLETMGWLKTEAQENPARPPTAPPPASPPR